MVRIAEVELRSVTKVFGPKARDALELLNSGLGKQEVEARTGTTVGVYNASLEIHRGEIFVVMGLSGSGKSTLLRCINRMHDPTAGTVIAGGVNVTELDRKGLQELRRQKFGMVFQRFALFPHRSVRANVEYGLEVRGVPPDERGARAEEVLELVGLAGWGDRRPDELSGGMQQRVGLARALAVDPDILLMDEAFSALDPLIKREMQEELLTLQSQVQKTIVFITHDLDEALKLGDRIAVMRAGQIVQIGTPEEIISRPASEYVAAFTAGVDRSKVLTAGSVMKAADPVIRPKDGPNTALQRMRHHGISSIFMVENDGRLIGLVHAADARKAADLGAASLMEWVQRELPLVTEEASLRDVICAGTHETWPIPVVDKRGRLRGLLVKGAILSALAETADAPSGEGARENADTGEEETTHAAL